MKLNSLHIPDILMEDVVLRPQGFTLSEPQETPATQVEKYLDHIRALLKTAIVQKLKPVTFLYEEANLSRNLGNRVKDSITRLKLATEEKIQVQRGRGKAIITLCVTDKGYDFMNARNQTSGKGGVLHRDFQDAIAGGLKDLDLCPAVEYFLNGKAADVGVEIDGKMQAVEVVISSARYEHENWIKDRTAGFGPVFFIPKDTKVESIVRSELESHFGGRLPEDMHIFLLEEFFQYIREILGAGKTSPDPCSITE